MQAKTSANRKWQKRPMEDADRERLKQQVCVEPDRIGLHEEDLEVLRKGEAAYLWESPLAASVEEGAELARQAAAGLSPAAGWRNEAVILHILIGPGHGLATVEAIASEIRQVAGKTASLVFSTGFSEEKGIRFWVAVAEGRMTEEEGTQ